MATVLSFFDNFTLQEIGQAMQPFALSPVPNPNAAAKRSSISTMLTGLRVVPNLGLLTTFLAGDSDRAIVQRTWGLFFQIPSKKDESYGPNFNFGEYMKTRNWLSGLFVHLSIAVVGFLFVMLPSLRNLVKRFVYEQGQGPDVEQAKKDEIEYRGVATPDTNTAAGQQAYCRAWFNGSMYACEYFLPGPTREDFIADFYSDRGFLGSSRSHGPRGRHRSGGRWSLHSCLPWAGICGQTGRCRVQDRDQDSNELRLVDWTCNKLVRRIWVFGSQEEEG